MTPARPRRSSGKRVSYSYKEAFKDLELSGSESEQQEMEDEDEAETSRIEPDDFVPPDEDEDEAEDFVDDVEEDEDGDSEGDDYDGDSVIDTSGLPVKPKKTAAPRRESSIDLTFNIDIDASIASATPAPNRVKKGPRRGTGTTHAALNGTRTGAATIRQRPAKEWREGGHGNRLKNLFGPTPENLSPVFEVKNRWLSQAALPERSAGHLAPTPFVSDAAREKETRVLRKWYTDHGQDAFVQGQETRQMDETESQTYLANPGPQSLNLLMGGIKEQRVYTLNKGEFLSASTPFGPKDKRKGWTFHLGSRIQDAQWAPNEQGPTQHLAVIVEQSGKKNWHAPAFSETKPFPGSVQIWAFESTDDGGMDPKKDPRLAHVICTDWGAPKTIRWWPVGASDSTDQGDGMVRLGLLAGIWSDGKVRVLDVTYPKGESSSQTQYVHYTKAALENKFPDTIPNSIPSCLCWVSPSTLAVGTASGILTLWTLSRVGMFSSKESYSPRPWFHKQVSDTYIITMSSAYPSRPHFISISTADGFTRLIDLRTPLVDAISSPRGRMLVYAQAWHEHTQSFAIVDEYYLLKHSSIRRYHQANYIFRMESTISAIATSMLHPGVLLGGADGSVWATNGVNKFFKSKELPWSQMWFQHEWRRAMQSGGADGAEIGTTEDGDIAQSAAADASALASASATAPASSPAPASPADPVTFSKPLTRITEGYKAVENHLEYPKNTKRNREGAKFITIYEENSAVTRLAWNPNLKFGSWAVAGMQSGMLRVEDFGL